MKNTELLKPFYFDDAVWGAKTWRVLSAAFTGDLSTVRQMLDEDPALIHAQFAYYEPLHYAVRGENAEIVKLLLERGAHPKAPGWNRLGDETPINKAKDRENSQILKLLEDAAREMPPYVWPEPGAVTDLQKKQHEFEIACGYNPDKNVVENTLKERPDWAVNGLYEAIHHNRMDIACMLLDAGADVHGMMSFACWFTPFMHALRYEQPRWAMAELLLNREVSVNTANGLGISPLHIVVLQGNTEAAQWLITHGADVNAIEPESCSTPFGWSAKYGKPKMASLLLQHGASVNLPAGLYWARPDQWAKKYNHPEVERLIG